MITMLMTACGPSVEEQEVAVTATQAVNTEIVDEPTVAATDTPPPTAVTSEQAEPAEATPTSAPAPFARRVSMPSMNMPPSTPMNRPTTMRNESKSDVMAGLTNSRPSKVPAPPAAKFTNRPARK